MITGRDLGGIRSDYFERKVCAPKVLNRQAAKQRGFVAWRFSSSPKHSLERGLLHHLDTLGHPRRRDGFIEVHAALPGAAEVQRLGDDRAIDVGLAALE